MALNPRKAVQVNNYVVIFSLESLKQPDGQPNAAVCTVYNLITMQAKMVGHAIQEGGLDDPIPFVEIISDQPETERDKIIEWLKFCDIEVPRALRLADTPIGDYQIMAVFDDDQTRVDLWRSVGATCFQLGNAKAQIVVPNRKLRRHPVT